MEMQSSQLRLVLSQVCFCCSVHATEGLKKMPMFRFERSGYLSGLYFSIFFNILSSFLIQIFTCLQVSLVTRYQITQPYSSTQIFFQGWICKFISSWISLLFVIYFTSGYFHYSYRFILFLSSTIFLLAWFCRCWLHRPDHESSEIWVHFKRLFTRERTFWVDLRLFCNRCQ